MTTCPICCGLGRVPDYQYPTADMLPCWACGGAGELPECDCGVRPGQVHAERCRLAAALEPVAEPIVVDGGG